MSSFKISMKLVHNNPGGVSRSPAVGVELQDRESLFYAKCGKLLWASASEILWKSFIEILKRRHLVSYLLF